MTKTLRFVKQTGAIYRVLLETPAGCWLIDCNGPSTPFFAANLDSYERVPAPESWISEQTITPAQEARLKMIQPLLDCTDCISDKSLRYQMAAEIAQQNQTTTRRILRLYYRYLATGRLMQKRKQQITVKELFQGKSLSQMGAVFPNTTIPKVLAQLPSGFLDIRDMVIQHTLFPYYTRCYR